MARHQYRQWYVLPTVHNMTWTPYEESEIPIQVLAFSFDGDTVIWLTVNGVVADGNEVRQRFI